MFKHRLEVSLCSFIVFSYFLHIFFEKITSALRPPPRQSLSPADSSSQTCQSDFQSFVFLSRGGGGGSDLTMLQFLGGFGNVKK